MNRALNGPAALGNRVHHDPMLYSLGRDQGRWVFGVHA